MDLNIFQETNPVSGSNVLVGAIYKNSAPTVLIASFPYPGPYTGQTQTHTFPGLLDVAYRYVCWESPDGSPSGTPRNDFVVQPSSNAYLTRDDLYITADIDPTIIGGGSSYGPDSTLIGWNWDLERRNEPGTLKCGRDYLKTKAGVDTIQDDLDADGWRIINGEIINSNEDFIHHFQPQISFVNAPPPPNVISAITRIKNNTSLDASAVGKCFLLAGGGASFFNVDLPSIASVADTDVISFTSYGGTHTNVQLTAPEGAIIWVSKTLANLGTGTLSSYIILAQGETLTLTRWSNPDNPGTIFWLILNSDGGFLKVGEQVNSLTLQLLNCVILNGQALSKINYKRLWDWINTIESRMLVSQSTWQTTAQTLGVNGQSYFTQRGNFADIDTNSFRVPDLTLFGFQRFANTGNGSIFRVNQIPTHDHTMHGSGTIAGAGGPYYLSRSNGSGYSGAGANTFGGRPSTSGPDLTMRTGKDNNTIGGVPNNTQFENEPNNFGVYPLIRI